MSRDARTITLPPGATLGILGGGQLGRMTALAAARLGYRSHVYCADADEPAAQVAAAATVGSFDDWNQLARFAAAVDVATLEWENIPLDAVVWVGARVTLRPGPRALAVAQDRRAEKAFTNRLGIATAPWRPVGSAAELALAATEIKGPTILKAARMGYDGKGQRRLEAGFDAVEAWSRLGTDAAVLEAVVDFASEISVIVARDQSGTIACYPAVENQHANHVLSRTIAPARLPAVLAAEAERVAARIATGLEIIGLLAVEMFVTPAGEILVNELAPRPHNSGHWTIDACPTSQFEQLVRAVCGLPLGSVDPIADAVMDNLLGVEAERWPALMAEPGVRLHLYGKQEMRPGRKMGHVTRLYPRGHTPDIGGR